MTFTSNEAQALLTRADTPRTVEIKKLRVVGESWFNAAATRQEEIDKLKADLSEATQRKEEEKRQHAEVERELEELKATVRRQGKVIEQSSRGSPMERSGPAPVRPLNHTPRPEGERQPSTTVPEPNNWLAAIGAAKVFGGHWAENSHSGNRKKTGSWFSAEL